MIIMKEVEDDYFNTLSQLVNQLVNIIYMYRCFEFFWYKVSNVIIFRNKI